MKNFGLDTRWVNFWAALIFILIVGPGCAVGLLSKGIIIPPETIEQYKNMPEDSPVLQSLREQAKKDPEGMTAASLKCADRLEGEDSGGKIDTPQSDKIKEPATEVDADSPPVEKKGFFEGILSQDILSQGGKEECYWKSPQMLQMSNPFTAQQDALTGSLRNALINLGKAQVIMAKALGLDEQVMLAENNVKGLEAGDLGTSDEVEKSIETSASVQDAIAAETAKKTVLDGASKAVFATSVPFYTKGVLGSIQTGVQAFQIGQNMVSLNPMALLQIGALVTIVSNLPDLISKLSSSTGQIMDFMTANEIDNSEMKDELADAF